MFKQALPAFFKKPTTVIGIATALLFQVIFSVIWMTGYAGVTDHVGELRIAVVGEDPVMVAMVQERLIANLPFQVTAESDLQAAMEKLSERDYHMIVQIPDGFSQRVQSPEQSARLVYHINESNPAMIKSAMQGVAGTITAMVNEEASGRPARVESDFRLYNRIDGMNNQMVPMMLVLASYVGAMIMAMNLQQSSVLIGPAVSRWRKFAARSFINLVSAVLIALLGTALVQLLGGQAEQGFFANWGFQALFLLAFMFFSQIFLILFGNAGMLFNIIALSAQLVSSGAMVPREMLSGFYHGLGQILPATYAVEGSMNLLFGGPGAGSAVAGLLIITGVSLVIGIVATAVRREKPVAAERAGSPA